MTRHAAEPALLPAVQHVQPYARQVGIHQERTHPEYVDGCWTCRLNTVAIPASTNTTTTGGLAAAQSNAVEKRLDVDRPAYKRLRQQGLQPRRVGGSARLERHAEDRVEVESGHLLNPGQLKQVKQIAAGEHL